MVKPATGTIGNNHTCIGSSGVLEDSAYVKGSTRNLGDPHRCRSNTCRECITGMWPVRKSEEFVVAGKSGNSDGAKGLYRMDANSERE